MHCSLHSWGPASCTVTSRNNHVKKQHLKLMQLVSTEEARRSQQKFLHPKSNDEEVHASSKGVGGNTTNQCCIILQLTTIDQEHFNTIREAMLFIMHSNRKYEHACWPKYISYLSQYSPERWAGGFKLVSLSNIEPQKTKAHRIATYVQTKCILLQSILSLIPLTLLYMTTFVQTPISLYLQLFSQKHPSPL